MTAAILDTTIVLLAFYYGGRFALALYLVLITPSAHREYFD